MTIIDLKLHSNNKYFGLIKVLQKSDNFKEIIK